MSKVSIVVPVYNVERYLRQCLDSIINQTLKDIEIICVNDGSTDDSLNILNEYAKKDNRIKIVNKINTGYGNSMNIGFSKATGEYIGIVESDDFAELDMYNKMYNVAIKYSSEVVMSNFTEFETENSTYDVFNENFRGFEYNKVIDPINEKSIFFTKPSIWSGIYKRDFLVENNIVFSETPGASYQDLSFSFKIWASAKKIYLLKDAFIHYRKDNMNSSINSSGKIFCVCDEYGEIDKFLKNMILKDEKLKMLIFSMKFKTYKWNYNRLTSVFQYTFLLRMVSEFKEAMLDNKINNYYLNDSEIREISDIVNNTDKYFKETSKNYKDDRLIRLTDNINFYKDGFIDYVSKFKNIIIYGAGSIGTMVGKKIICEFDNENNIYFGVSNSNDNPKSLLSKPVFSIEKLMQYSDNSVVIVSVKEKDQYDIINKLKKMHFKNVVSIDSNLLKALNI